MLDEGDFTVLVDLKSYDDSPDYYVVPTSILDERLKLGFKQWVESPGRGGRLRNPDSRMFRIEVPKGPTEWLQDYRRAWEVVINYLALEKQESPG